MTQPKRIRIFAESLEERNCPAVAASFVAGTLTVSGFATNPGDTIFIKELAANQFEVDDGATVVTTQSGVTNVKVNLTSADDLVTINLGGNTAAGYISVNLGNGTNNLSVVNGTIKGSLCINGGRGADTVTLGEASDILTLNGATSFFLCNDANTLSVIRTTATKGLSFFGGSGLDTVTIGDGTLPVSITGNLFVNGAGGTNDVLTVNKFVTLTGDLTSYYANNVTIAAGSTINGSALLNGGTGGNTIDAAGTITGDLKFYSPFYLSYNSSTLHLASTAVVGRDLIFTSSYYNYFGNSLTTDAGSSIGRDLKFSGTNLTDTVSIAGNIVRDLVLTTGNGGDMVSVANTTTIGNHVVIGFGNGNNMLDFDAVVNNSSATSFPAFYVVSGKGSNVITVGATANITGNAAILLGSGSNLVDLRDAATITGKLTANGGGNATSKFRGSVKPNHPTMTVTGFPIIDGTPNP